ncbi:addiction module antidote protein [Sinimarinibacterium sp. NLF-5-8]|uniref:addiction module antidote protein n=1 Tax=Sinimarinibacterium sp. NLF-5-8 TaxID=2698684 RepID=UPI00137BA5C4|nr:addiction module antidote protein [Sinimarinibacterium sp. NLF-5-8]QHS10298.1 putative addiction module antidote protein [Sinimarinibacterium sp. NLF-5-8]
MSNKIKTTPWNVRDHLKIDEDCQLYIEACFEEAGDDPAFIIKALGDVARAKGMMQITRETGLARESLYRALSEHGNPSFATVMRITRALGVRLTTVPA